MANSPIGLINPQKPTHLNHHIPSFNRPAKRAKLQAQLEQLLSENHADNHPQTTQASQTRLANFLEKEIPFVFSSATEALNTQLQQIFSRPAAKAPFPLSPNQIRILQDIGYLGRLDSQLRSRSLPALYRYRRLLTKEINELLPRKNFELRRAAHEHITRRIIERYLDENCAWLRHQEKQLRNSLQKALNQLFFQSFEIENENPKYLDNTIRYTIPVLEQLGPFLQKITNLAERGQKLADTAREITTAASSAARPNPLPPALRPLIATQARRANALARISSNAPLKANAGLYHTVDTYARIYADLLQKPVAHLFKVEIQKEKRENEAEIAHLPYHPLIHNHLPETQ